MRSHNEYVMSNTSDGSQTFVFEYRNSSELSEAVFHQIMTQIQQNAEDISGFRIELTTNSPVDVSFDDLVGRQSTVEISEDDRQEIENQESTVIEAEETQRSEEPDETSETESEAPSEIPSLHQGTRPAQVLAVLRGHGDGPFRTDEIQGGLDEDIETSAVSQTLANLDSRGLVESEPDPEDNRANVYQMTDLGRRALDELEERIDEEMIDGSSDESGET